MTRRPDWAVRLAALLSAVETRPFDAHRWNCGRFALAAVEAVTGERPAFRVQPDLAASADSASSAISAYSKAIQTGKVDSDGWQSILAVLATV